MKTRAFAAKKEKGKLEEVEITLSDMTADSVEVDIEYCGVCHSDLSMIDNSWQFSNYPLVAGHEIIGRISDLGEKAASRFKVGDRVGIGWFSKACSSCERCLDGYYNMCKTAEQTIIGRPGGFADKIRVDASWTIPLPENLNPKTAGPLFCGGVTVFNPIVEYDIKSTDRVGVIGIGGLGHMALKFLNAWGCDVTAFTSNPDKYEEAKKLGAHHVINSRDENELSSIQASLDFILVTANGTLDWNVYLNTLKPNGRLHFVGAVLEPLNVGVFNLLSLQKSISASPLGKPSTILKMLEFCERHQIEPQTEHFKFSEINEAIDKLRDGSPRYRIVLENNH